MYEKRQVILRTRFCSDMEVIQFCCTCENFIRNKTTERQGPIVAICGFQSLKCFWAMCSATASGCMKWGLCGPLDVNACQGLRTGLCGLDQGITFVTKVSPVLLERTWFVWHIVVRGLNLVD